MKNLKSLFLLLVMLIGICGISYAFDEKDNTGKKCSGSFGFCLKNTYWNWEAFDGTYHVANCTKGHETKTHHVFKVSSDYEGFQYVCYCGAEADEIDSKSHQISVNDKVIKTESHSPNKKGVCKICGYHYHSFKENKEGGKCSACGAQAKPCGDGHVVIREDKIEVIEPHTFKEGKCCKCYESKTSESETKDEVTMGTKKGDKCGIIIKKSNQNLELNTTSNLIYETCNNTLSYVTDSGGHRLICGNEEHNREYEEHEKGTGTCICGKPKIGDDKANIGTKKGEKCGIDNCTKTLSYMTSSGGHRLICGNEEHNREYEEHEKGTGTCICGKPKIEKTEEKEPEKKEPENLSQHTHTWDNGKCTDTTCGAIDDSIRCYKDECEHALLKKDGPYNGYYATEKDHYTVCSVDPNHQSNIVAHTPVNGKCSVCGYGESPEQTPTEQTPPEQTTPEQTQPENTGGATGESTEPESNAGVEITVRTIRTCPECKKDIGREWYITEDGVHYRACVCGHNFFEKEGKNSTVCTGELCDLCDRTVNKCSEKGCKGVLSYGYQATEKIHSQKCTKGHTFEGNHVYSTVSPKVCTTCFYDKEAKKIIKQTELLQTATNLIRCSMCNSKTQWIQTETMHVMVCTKDSSHIMRIEGHTLNSNNKCISCEKTITKEYPVTFVDFADKTHWGWRNVGNLVELGIVGGDKNANGERILVPNEYITAEAFIALLARTLGHNGEEEISDGSLYCPISSDWSKDEWKYLMSYIAKNRPTYNAKTEIQVALSNNSKSASDEEIARNYKHAITRERAAYLLGMFIDSNQRQNDLADTFGDWGEVTSAYKERLLRLSAYDILKGSLENGRLYVNPTDPITRVEAIALIDRFYSLQKAGYKY